MSPAKATEVTMILNRGAGLSTVATRALPDGSQSALIQKKPVRLRVADGNPIPTNGYVLLWVRLGEYVTQDEFLVRENLPTTMLLGAKDLDKNLGTMHLTEAEVELSSLMSAHCSGREAAELSQ